MSHPGTVPQWDYKAIYLSGAPQWLEPALKQLGYEGWELISMTFHSATGPLQGQASGVFKRMVTPQTPFAPSSWGPQP